jgi:hypothetical protein
MTQSRKVLTVCHPFLRVGWLLGFVVKQACLNGFELTAGFGREITRVNLLEKIAGFFGVSKQ